MLKKIFLFTLLLGLYNLYAVNRNTAAAIKFGMWKPKATSSGFVLGFEYGKHIDRNLDICLTLDWLKKDYTDSEHINKIESNGGSLTGNIKKKLKETILYDFPLMFNITTKFPINTKFKWFLSGGLGLEMLFADYHNYVDEKIQDETTFAFDFNWRAGAGLMYSLGRYSEIFIDAVWHGSSPSYEYKDEINGKKHTFEKEYNMSGILTRIGVRYCF